MVLSVALSIYQAATIVDPIRRLTDVVDHIAQGDYSTQMLPTRRDEVGQLAGAVNELAQEQAQRLADLAIEQRRLSTVLDHMADGVLFIGGDGDTRAAWS